MIAESDSLRQFVARSVEREPSGSITVEEVQTGYENFCANLGWVALNKNQVERQLGPLMMEFHRAAKRNDIERGGRQKRGFAGVRLHSPDESEAQP